MHEKIPNARIFAANLKKVRKERNVTQAELAEAINVQKSSISNYEQSVSIPDIPKALEIARVLCVDDLNAFFGYSPENKAAENMAGSRYIPIHDKVIYGENPLEPGNEIDRMMMPAINLKSGDFFGFIVQDNSMSRSNIKKGDIAIIKKQSLPSTGDIVLAVDNEGNNYLRKLYMLDGGIASFQPDSDESSFLPLSFDLTEDEIDIKGRVVFMYMSV